MGSTASLSINSLDINDSQRVAWYHSTLVETESELFLSFGFIHEAFLNIVTIVDDPVCLVLNCFLLFLGETHVMSDI